MFVLFSYLNTTSVNVALSHLSNQDSLLHEKILVITSILMSNSHYNINSVTYLSHKRDWVAINAQLQPIFDLLRTML